MRNESIQRFAIVKADSAAAFEEELNARISELANNRPVVSFHDADPLFARISYTENVKVPETLSDEYALKGITFRCEDCPNFTPMAKADGTEDKRLKYGECQYARMGRTYRDSMACELLFQMIADGRVGLCLKR